MSQPTLCGILALTMWMLIGVLIVLTAPMPPFLLSAVTFLTGAICIYIVETVRGARLSSLRPLPVSTYLFGIMGMGIYTILLYAAYKTTFPFLASTLNHLWPIFLALGLAYQEQRKPGFFELVGLVMGFTGAALIFGRNIELASFSLNNKDLLGCLMALLAAIIWATYSVKTRSVDYPALATAVFFLISAVIAGVLHLLFEETKWPAGFGWICLGILGVGRVTYTLWDYAMKKGDRELLSSLSYFVPLGSAGLLTIAGHVPPSNLLIFGGILIAAGSVVTNFKKLRG